MEYVQGKGVYGAIAIGPVMQMEQDEGKVCRHHVEDTEMELRRLQEAKKRALGQLDEIYKKALKEVGQTHAMIFEVHKMMMDDEDYNESVQHVITGQSVNAEYAVAVTGDLFADMYAGMEDAYMRERAADIRDVSNRLIACLHEKEGAQQDTKHQAIVCAKDLAPSETVSLDKERVLAFVTAYGSSNSHTAILARNMNIPAVIGVGEAFISGLKDTDMLAVDGYTGEVWKNPDQDTLDVLKKKQKKDQEKRQLLEKMRGKENKTIDGTNVRIYANISSVDALGEVLFYDAGGVGLFRSEFLYLEREEAPGEEQQFQAYKKALESLPGKEVIIRTLDIGADKRADYLHLDEEENPALGLRAIRLCLARPDMFRTQLRALYRASVYGKLGIMFPMITSVNELERIREIVKQVKSELDEEKIPYSHDIKTGIMIETPAAAVISDQLAPLVDFFSVGTNDLTQYTLACDRQNARVEEFVDTHHESVLRLIAYAAKCAHEHGAWIGICGELAADTTLTGQFLRMGIDELSVSPSMVLRVRDAVRRIDLNNLND